MPDFSNIISVDLSEAQGFKVESHKAVHQWDSGVILQLTGATLPSGSRAQFDTKTTTYNQDITSGQCEIPNALLGYEMTGDIKCHVYIITENYGIVVYDIHIPVIRRPKPDSYIYTDNTSSENGWIKTDNGFKVNEGQSYLGRTTLKVDDNGALLTGSQLSLANQGTIINGNSISLASGAASLHAVDGLSLGSGAGSLTENQLSLASGATTLSSTALSLDSSKATLSGTQLSLNSGRITIGPNKLLVDSRVFGSVNIADKNQVEQGTIVFDSGVKSTDANRCRSGFIKVNPSNIYSITIGSSVSIGIRGIVQYNSLQNFISTIQDENIPVTKVFTVGNTTEYICLVFQNSSYTAITPSDITNLQLEEGPTASAYVPHCLDNVELTNRCYVQDWKSKNLWGPDVGYAMSTPTSAAFTERFFNTTIVRVEPEKTYTLSFKSQYNLTVGYLVYYTNTDEYAGSSPTMLSASPSTFTIPSNVYGIRSVFVNLTPDVTTTVDIISDVQLEEGYYATAYSPFYALDNMALTSRRFVQDWKSKNLADVSTLSQGQYGVNTSDLRRVFSGLCQVKGNTTYTCSFTTAANTIVNYIIAYDSTGTQISSWSSPTNQRPMAFTTPNGCVNVRIQFTNQSTNITPSDITNLQLEEGPTATPYVPYSLTVPELSENTKAISYGQYPYTTTVDLTSISSRLSIMKDYWSGSPFNLHAVMYAACPNTNNNTAISFTEFYNWLRNRGPSATGSVLLSAGSKVSTNSQSIPVSAGWYFYSFISHRCGYPTDANSTDNNRRGYIELKALLPSVHQCYRCKIDDYNGVWRVSYFDQEWREHNSISGYNSVTVSPSTISVNHEGLVSIYAHITTPSGGLTASTPFATIPAPKNDFTFSLAGSITFNIQNNNGEGRLRNGGQALGGSTGYDLFVTYHTSDENYYYRL